MCVLHDFSRAVAPARTTSTVRSMLRVHTAHAIYDLDCARSRVRRVVRTDVDAVWADPHWDGDAWRELVTCSTVMPGEPVKFVWEVIHTAAGAATRSTLTSDVVAVYSTS